MIRRIIPRGMYRFFFHLHKARTKVRGEPIWSLHFRDKCYFVSDIICTVPIETKSNKEQPIAVVRGFARYVDTFDDGSCLIHN